MKSTPILFNGDMVRAILDGRKTQTRRIIKPQPAKAMELLCLSSSKCPFGIEGDELWVRETWQRHPDIFHQGPGGCLYRADRGGDLQHPDGKWRPSIHMPRWASRLTLKNKSVRVERLREISEDDARAEGAPFGQWYPSTMAFYEPTDEADIRYSSYKAGFQFLWESINGPESWVANPWVWVVEFERKA